MAVLRLKHSYSGSRPVHKEEVLDFYNIHLHGVKIPPVMFMLKQKLSWVVLITVSVFVLGWPIRVIASHGGDYHFVNDVTISGPDGNLIFDQNGERGPGYYVDNEECYNYVLTSSISDPPAGADVAQATFIELETTDGDCFTAESSSTEIEIGDFSKSTISAGEEESVPSCASNGGALAWLACPLSELLLNAIQALADLMNTLLSVQPLETGGTVYTVWSNVRNIALAMFVIAVLIVIFGQSLSIDAYTVKRIAPRLGIAAIGIMLSFYIAAFAIDIFNVLGQGMYRLLLGTLSEQEIATTPGGVAAEWVTGGALLAGGAIAFISQGAFAFFVMILVPIMLAMFTGFAVIVARQVILILLVIVAPIAIAAWTLPNTEEYFKKWRGLFSSLLMMYPIIMILLAAGSIFAVVVSNGEGTITESNFINQVIALFALGLTVGLIPLTLRLSSSLLGRIASAVNDPNRGAIDRLRKAGQARGDARRDVRRQNKLTKYGELKSEEKSGGDNRRLYKGWLRGTTGMYGYGRVGKDGEGKYGGTAMQEAIAGARSSDQRQTIAKEKAERETDQLADFAAKQRTAEWTAIGDTQDEIMNKLRDDAMDTSKSLPDRRASFRQLVTLRAVPQLEQVINGATGADGMPIERSESEVTNVKRMINDSFGDIDGFAAHVSRADVSNRGAKLSYSVLGELPGEILTRQKPDAIQSAIEYAARTGDSKLAGKIITSYANAAPHQRTPDMTAYISSLVRDQAVTVPEQDASGQNVIIQEAVKDKETDQPILKANGEPKIKNKKVYEKTPRALPVPQDAASYFKSAVLSQPTEASGRPQPKPENVSPGGVILPDSSDPNARVDSSDLPREPGSEG